VAIISFLQTGFWGGAINASSPTYSIVHNFAPSKVNVWSYPSLQNISSNDDDAFINTWVNNFDGSKHPGTHHHPGIIAHNCSWVEFGMEATDCLAWAVLTSEFFN
jgi:hypothetical protein